MNEGNTKTRKLTGCQKSFLAAFKSGALNASSRGSSSDAAICKNLVRRGLLAADGSLTAAGELALMTGSYAIAA
jgi:hypothetical protein